MTKTSTNKNQIKTNEHVFICGSTGCGKTFLTKYYLSRYKNVIVLDTKGTFSWGNRVRENDSTMITNLKQITKVKTDKIIYRPVADELENSYYNLFFKFCYERENTIIFIDEASQVCKNSMSYPQYYKNCLQRGREKNVACWSLTQRPSDIYQGIITESTHFFVFRLNRYEDRKKVAHNASQDKFLNKMSGYNFQYWRADQDNDPLHRVIKIKKN